MVLLVGLCIKSCGADQLSTVTVLLVGLHRKLRANQLSTVMVLLVGL